MYKKSITREINNTNNVNNEIVRSIEVKSAALLANTEKTHSVQYSPEKCKQYRTVFIDEQLSDERCE